MSDPADTYLPRIPDPLPWFMLIALLTFILLAWMGAFE